MVEERGDRFWELCHERLFDDAMDTIDEALMDRSEFNRFERSTMTFGQYKGEQIGNISTDYLNFIANTIGWIRKLNKYLKTKAYRE